MAFHVSAQEAARDFLNLLAKVRDGEEIVIENGSLPIAVLHSPKEEIRPRLLSQSIALAERHERELGYSPSMDDEFVADMEEIIRNRKPRASAWD